MVTIHDVARAAGVSSATVSRVLNKPDIVSPDKVARVRTVIEELGFQRSVVARDLRLRSSHTIGLLVADISQPSQAALAKSVERAAERSGYAVMLGDLDHREDRLLAFLRAAPSRGLAGVLVATGDEVDKRALTEAMQQLEGRGIRVVTLAQAVSTRGVPTVSFDYEDIGRTAATHLFEQGRSHLLLVGGGGRSWYSQRLEVGIREHARHVSGSVHVANGRFQQDSAHSAVAALIAQGLRPDGVIVANTPMAMGAMKALREAGLTVPDDVGVVVCQSEPFAEYVTPSLTVVDADLKLHGETAVSLLLRRIDGETVDPLTVLPHTLVPRESTIVQHLAVHRRASHALRASSRERRRGEPSENSTP